MWQTGPSPVELQKDQFVSLWLRNNDPFEAARAVFPAEIGRALQASTEWPKDEYCLSKRKALLDEFGLEHFLPSHAEFAQMLLTDARECRTKQDKHKFMELYAKTMKYVNNDPPQKGKGQPIQIVASDIDQSL